MMARSSVTPEGRSSGGSRQTTGGGGFFLAADLPYGSSIRRVFRRLDLEGQQAPVGRDTKRTSLPRW